MKIRRDHYKDAWYTNDIAKTKDKGTLRAGSLFCNTKEGYNLNRECTFYCYIIL